jgi:hypothetical protein
VDDIRLGLVVRLSRGRRGWRQDDLAARAGVPRRDVSLIETGRARGVRLGRIRAVLEALAGWVYLQPRMPGGDVARTLNAGHAAMHEVVASVLADVGGWEVAHEVSFSIYGERGVIDLLGWHAETRTLLVVELKTAIVDANEMVGSMDRRRRLAVRIARERGWEAAAVATWVLVSDTRANRRRLADHAGLLGTAFPADGRAMRRWLGHPVAAVAALSFLSPDRNTRDKHTSRVPRRVRVPRVRSGRRRNARGSRGMLRSARISHERQEGVGPGSGARQSSGQARPRPRRSWSATMRRWIWFVPS